MSQQHDDIEHTVCGCGDYCYPDREGFCSHCRSNRQHDIACGVRTSANGACTCKQPVQPAPECNCKCHLGGLGRCSLCADDRHFGVGMTKEELDSLNKPPKPQPIVRRPSFEDIARPCWCITRPSEHSDICSEMWSQLKQGVAAEHDRMQVLLDKAYDDLHTAYAIEMPEAEWKAAELQAEVERLRAAIIGLEVAVGDCPSSACQQEHGKHPAHPTSEPFPAALAPSPDAPKPEQADG